MKCLPCRMLDKQRKDALNGIEFVDCTAHSSGKVRRGCSCGREKMAGVCPAAVHILICKYFKDSFDFIDCLDNVFTFLGTGWICPTAGERQPQSFLRL